MRNAIQIQPRSTMGNRSFQRFIIFYISVILYLYAGGYKCRLTTYPTRFAHDVFCAVVTALLYCNCCAMSK